MKQSSKGSRRIKRGKGIASIILLGVLILGFGAGNVFFLYDGYQSLQIEYTKAKENAGQEKSKENMKEQENYQEENQPVYTSSLESFSIRKSNAKAKEDKYKTKKIVKLTELHATASSELASSKQYTYGVSNLLDNNLSTAWVEGVKGNGEGEEFTISSKQPIVIKKIAIFNGYQKNKDVLKRNAQIKKIMIVASDGTEKTVSLKKAEKCKKSEMIKFETGIDGVTEVKFRIVNTYSGTNTSKGSKASDTCVSEICLYGYTQ